MRLEGNITATVPRARPEHPRVAVIDIGSSAIRMEIAQLGPGQRTTILESLQRGVPLGRDCFSRGRLEARTINLAIEVLRGYQRIMQPYDVAAVRAVATSAAREASNRELFVERVFMATGIAVEVISAAEEDRLVYAAVREAFRRERLRTDADALILGLGSGSIEISLFKHGEVVAASAYPLGSIRLLAAVGADRRPAPETMDLMKRYVDSSLDEIEHSFALDQTRHFVIVGAEARLAVDQILGGRQAGQRVRSVPRNTFLRFAREIGKLRPEEIATRYALPLEECESLNPALLTSSELLKRTPAKQVVVPVVSMRDGLLLDFAAEATGQRDTELDAQIYASAENLGRRFQFDEPHAHQVADLACCLFDLLGAELRLGRRERRLLRVAALIHDIGLFISSNSHHKHSEYIVNASDIFGVRADDKAIVACVARYHRRALPHPAHPVYASLSREDRATVSKLAAILRVADALDRSHSQRVRLVSVELGPEETVLHVRAAGDLALERLAVRAKGDLFEEVFGRKIVLQLEGSEP